MGGLNLGAKTRKVSDAECLCGITREGRHRPVSAATSTFSPVYPTTGLRRRKPLFFLDFSDSVKAGIENAPASAKAKATKAKRLVCPA